VSATKQVARLWYVFQVLWWTVFVVHLNLHTHTHFSERHLLDYARCSQAIHSLGSNTQAGYERLSLRPTLACTADLKRYLASKVHGAACC
jgi:hypothetical protein